MTKHGAGELIISGANVFDGRWTNWQGTLTFPAGSAIGDPTVDFYMEGGTVNLNNGASTVASIRSAPANTTGVVNLGSGTTLTVTGGGLEYYGIFAGAGGLTYSGVGTYTVRGNNTHGGLTQVASGNGAGILIMTGNNSGNGGYDVQSGILRLNGANTGTGDTTLNGGRLEVFTGASLANSTIKFAPDATLSLKVLTAGGTFPCIGMNTWGSSTLDFQFGFIAPSTTTAPLQVNGNVDFSGGDSTVTITAYNIPSGSGDYPLVAWTGTATGSVYGGPGHLGTGDHRHGAPKRQQARAACHRQTRNRCPGRAR